MGSHLALNSFPNHMIFFFFLISNKDVYSKNLPHAKKHKAEEKSTEKKKIKTKRKDTNYKEGSYLDMENFFHPLP